MVYGSMYLKESSYCKIFAVSREGDDDGAMIVCRDVATIALWLC